MHRSSFIRRTRAAFTLVELLTVIAIIGVLAALAMAGLGTVRAMARQSVCTSNLRQWGIALQSHLQANRGRIPYEGDDDAVSWANTQTTVNRKAWFNVLPPYVGSSPLADMAAQGRNLTASTKKAWFTGANGFYACGADERTAVTKYADTYISPGYMMNSQIYTSEGPAGTNNGTSLVSIHDLPGNINLSRLAFLADAGSDGVGTDRPRIRGHGDNLDFRHNHGVLIVFFDGHVRKFSETEITEAKAQKFNRTDLTWNPWVIAE